MSFGTSALLGTVETSLRMVSQRGSKQCHTRRATPVTFTVEQTGVLVSQLSESKFLPHLFQRVSAWFA